MDDEQWTARITEAAGQHEAGALADESDIATLRQG